MDLPSNYSRVGEHKSIATDRVILAPGPQREVFWVQEIYRLFTLERKTFAGIAAELESRGAPYLPGKRWSDHGGLRPYQTV